MQVSAFEIDGSRWPTGEIEFYVALDGTAASGISWNAAFIAAMNDWNDETSFNFILREQYRDPCLSDGLNSVGFSDNLCGSEFGKNTLAVTVQSFKSAILGGPTIAESDIIIDQNKSITFTTVG